MLSKSEVKEFKEYLLKDSNRIIKILEDTNFHDLWYEKEDVIRGALPDHDNNTSLRVVLNESLSTSMFSIGYNGDLIGAIQEIKSWDFTTTFAYMKALFGVGNSIQQSQTTSLIEEYRQFAKYGTVVQGKENKKYDNNYLSCFIPMPHKLLKKVFRQM